ncbi:MAG TPA: hypothetical protein VJT09_00835 [Pyrinomonadaceae bacterium]|nr:hypothetical protein [Pyrinomonadaceae bacterium]
MAATRVQNLTYATPRETARYQQRALIVGAVAMLILIVGAYIPAIGGSIDQFFRSYLVGYVFWTGVTLGCLGLLMLQHLTGGAWGLVIRRVLEAGTRTLPLMLLLFLPIAIFGMTHLYEWMHLDQVHEAGVRRIIEAKRPYLNPAFFLIRTAIYFAIWLGMMFLLNKWSADQDRTAERQYSSKMQKLSGPGIILFVLTVTFASVDWVMSLNVEWFSTIYGLLYVAGWVLSAFSFVIAVMVWLATRKPLEGVVLAPHFHDLGKLLLAFVMLWAYFAFSQFLIIWSGNIPEETKWYLHRLRGGWGWVGIGLVILHFALPFMLLLSRDLKRNARKLAMIAGLIFLMRIIDIFWLVAPEFNREHFRFSWMDLIVPFAFGGLWLAFFIWQLNLRPLLPFNDPNFEEAIEHGRHKGH